MNRTQAKQFRKDLQEALKSVEEQYDGEISLGGIGFSSSGASVKVTLKENPSDGKSIEQAEFEKFAFSFGLKKEDYREAFQFQGKSYRIVGFKIKSPKYPILGEAIGTNKVSKFPETVLSQFKDHQPELSGIEVKSF